jgi:hypothetical protein
VVFSLSSSAPLAYQIHNFELRSLSSIENHLPIPTTLRGHMISKAMKVVLTGTTGFIGQEVLNQALSHPSITSIIALSRKPLPPTFASDPKLKVVLIDDFSTYSPSVLSQLSGADACIWYVYLVFPSFHQRSVNYQLRKSTLSHVTDPIASTYTQQVHWSKVHRSSNCPQGNPRI